MLRPFRVRPSTSKTPPQRDAPSQAAIRVEIFYVGVGDQFDDDRRLVRDKSVQDQDPGLWHRFTNTCEQ